MTDSANPRQPPAPPMRPFSRSLPMALLKARETVMRRFRAILSEHDLSEQQWRVIRALHEKQTMETGELADLVFLLGPSLTRILQRLEARGLIARERQDEDQRKIDVSITAAGQEIFSVIAPVSEREYRRMESKLGQREIDSIMQALARMTEILGDSDDRFDDDPHSGEP